MKITTYKKLCKADTAVGAVSTILAIASVGVTLLQKIGEPKSKGGDK